MTRRLLAASRAASVLALLLAWPAFADTVEPPNISPPDSWAPRQAATLRVLNKLDSTVQSLTVHVGETAHVQTLSVTLRACAVRPPDLPADATAHLSVSNGDASFDNWILQNEPSINMFEDPVYDIQLAGCA